MRDIGGQLLHTCSVGGYEMPGFIFFASFLILMLFAVSSTLMMRQCVQLSRVLKDVTRGITRLKKNSGFLTSAEVAAISEIMAKDPVLYSAWHGFEESLLKSPNGDEIWATAPIEAHLTRVVIVEDHLHTAFYNAVPGVLTGLGLLMTFVAILDGLSHVSVSTTMDVTGIGGLINGLSGKFVSSIVAVTCAVSFVFVERIAYSKPHAAYRALIQKLVPRFKRRTAEHLLQQIGLQLVELRSAFLKRA